MEESDTLRPVLVMIHGGSLMSGVPDIPYAFRDQGFVVVGVRYRLNVMGFLALSELTKTDMLEASGNYGFSDQVTALKWVQRNAKAFGGDPSRVTIMGCSSGGSSVWNLIAIPSARGLFAHAVPLSSASRNNMTLRQAQKQNAPFVENVCGRGAEDTYKCLVEAKLERLMIGYDNLSKTVGFDHPFDFELPSPTEYLWRLHCRWRRCPERLACSFEFICSP
jgi:para-nitrobenzyl esterase